MSDDAAEEIMKRFDQWREDTVRSRFLNRMKHKLHAKERGRRW